jgi:hypothetical protein
VFALLLMAVSTDAGAGATEVGPMGDLRAARIEGCDKISAEQVRQALFKDVQVMALASPSAPLER